MTANERRGCHYPSTAARVIEILVLEGTLISGMRCGAKRYGDSLTPLISK